MTQVRKHVEPLCADEQLAELRREGWTFELFGPRGDVEALVAIDHRRPGAIVIVFRGPTDTAAYRVHQSCAVDPLTADHVVWHWIGEAGPAIYAARTLTDPSPGDPYPIPDACRPPVIRPRMIRPGTSFVATGPLSGAGAKQ